MPEDDPKKSTVNFQCNDAVELCLAIEREGISFYEQAFKKVTHPKVKEVFQRLARDEKDHTRTLQAKAKFLQPAVQNRARFNEAVNEFIQSEVKGKVFPMKEGRIAEVPDVKSDIEALEFGIQSEKRSIAILEILLAEERKIDVRAIFSHLLVEEKKHLASLEELKKELSS